jgi:transposase InsO family protein
MMAPFVAPNRQKLLPYLRPIDDDALWRLRAKAVLQDSREPMSEGDVLTRFAVDDGTTPPPNAREGYWSALADAEACGRLVHDHLELLTAASKVRILADDAPPVPSIVRAMVEGQHTSAPMYRSPRSSVITLAQPQASTLKPGQKDRWERSIALVRAKETAPRTEYKALAERFGFSIAQAKYFWAEYRRGGEEELRPGQRNGTGLRAEPEVKEVIHRLWKHSRRFRLKAILEHPELREVLKNLRAAGRPGALSYHQLCRYKREVLVHNKTWEAMRKGKKRLPAPDASGLVDPTRAVTQLLQVVEVDATKIDCHVLARDGRTVLVRMHVLYAIDVASRCVWAWRVCLEEPTEFDYLRLVQMGVRSKGELVASLGCHAYPVAGVPELLLHDRGWIFAAQGARERIGACGITIAHAAPYRPEMKGHIERFIGTMNTRWLHRLPGTTKSNAQERGGRDAEAEAKLLASDFERYLSLAIITGYADDLHTSLGCTPLEKWERVAKSTGEPRPWPSDPASKLKLDLLGLHDSGEVRKRTSVGYEWETLTFRPERMDAPAEARILYDPDDIRSIALVAASGPHTGSYGGEATLRGFPLDHSIPLAMVPQLKGQDEAPGLRTGSERMTELLAEIEGTGRRGANAASKTPKGAKKRATKLEVALRAAERNARGDAVARATPRPPEPTRTDIEDIVIERDEGVDE